MSKVRRSASAENDLLEAWLYIAEDSVDSADRLLDQIETEMDRLADAAGNGPRTRRVGGRPSELADVDAIHPVLFRGIRWHHDCTRTAPCAGCAGYLELAEELKK